jgi:hypothetical protein
MASWAVARLLRTRQAFPLRPEDLMRHLVPFTLAILAVAAACSTPMTMPEMAVDPALSFDQARARWQATQPLDYSFEFEAESPADPSPGFYRVTVLGGRLAAVRRSYSGEIAPLDQGFTIDELWRRLAAAKAAGQPLSDLQFSREGIPMQAAVGAAGSDAGVRYRLRSYIIGIMAFN